MKSHTSIFAGAAAGVFAVGAVTGWMAPSVLRSAHAESAVGADCRVRRHRPPVPPSSGPARYRAQLPRDRCAESGAVVGITTAGEMNVSLRPAVRRESVRLWQR